MEAMRWTLLLAVMAWGAAASGAETPGDASGVRIARFRGDCEAAISFTFDDGWEDAARLVPPMFERYGFRATFFIVPGLIPEEYAPEAKSDYGRVPWYRWREIAAAGHELGNHSFDHGQHFTDRDDDRLRHQILDAHALLKRQTGVAPASFALPSSNTLNDWTRNVVDSVHPATRTGTMNYGGKRCTVESANALADKLVERRAWGKPLLHAVEKGYDPFAGAEVLDGHLAYLAGLRERIWIDTFGAVAAYVGTRDAAEIQATPLPDGVRFRLVAARTAKTPLVPLTVVIPAENIDLAQAAREGDASTLPLAVRHGKLLVDVLPGEAPVTVRWVAAHTGK